MKLLSIPLMLFSLLACSKDAAAPQAWDRINSGALLIDVRTPEEYSGGHIERAINIPFDEVQKQLDRIGSDKGRAIVVYCRSGRRSEKAKKTLESLGYTNVTNAGGYDDLKSGWQSGASH